MCCLFLRLSQLTFSIKAQTVIFACFLGHKSIYLNYQLCHYSVKGAQKKAWLSSNTILFTEIGGSWIWSMGHHWPSPAQDH